MSSSNDLAALFRQHDMPGLAVDWTTGKPLSSSSWRSCPNASWMLEFAIKARVDRKVAGLATCVCARTALPFADDPRIEVCIETTERFLNGQATREELEVVQSAAVIENSWESSKNAAQKTAADSAWYAAEKCLDSDLARSSLFASCSALNAACSVAWGVGVRRDTWSAACMQHQKNMARIVRRFIPWSMIEERISR